MRKIKFRGKRVDNGEWIVGDLVHWRNEENTIQIIQEKFGCCVDEKGNIVLIEEPFVCKVIPETVWQYAGLHDKNGKEIYEGDIIEAPDDNDTYEICYSELECKFYFLGAGTFDFKYCREVYKNNIKIVGNIHENKDLIS